MIQGPPLTLEFWKCKRITDLRTYLGAFQRVAPKTNPDQYHAKANNLWWMYTM